ncbi:hypothetical protein DFJ74DRAFT_661865 [Hyaloraphidium curvatum]|nr:hypothetical protein DFJ74DRAFT_661865 [Hyaloraphidium curvatum]
MGGGSAASGAGAAAGKAWAGAACTPARPMSPFMSASSSVSPSRTSIGLSASRSSLIGHTNLAGSARSRSASGARPRAPMSSAKSSPVISDLDPYSSLASTTRNVRRAEAFLPERLIRIGSTPPTLTRVSSTGDSGIRGGMGLRPFASLSGVSVKT